MRGARGFPDPRLHRSLLPPSHFNHALQNARPDHQNVVLLLLGHLVRRSRLFLSTLKISAIEVDVRGIQVNRADSVMVRALPIDGPSSLQVLKRFAAKLGQAAARIVTTRIMAC